MIACLIPSVLFNDCLTQKVLPLALLVKISGGHLRLLLLLLRDSEIVGEEWRWSLKTPTILALNCF